jgi:predicted transposase/invertase (TIGR01784 family)
MYMFLNPVSRVYDHDDPLDIRKDPVFKAVFTKETPAARGALSKLVSTFISRDVIVETIWANEPPVENLKDRKMRFDINCRSENGERINVEMTFDPKPYEPVRLEFYAAKLYAGQDISGKPYRHLKRAYQITVLAQYRFFDDSEFLHAFEYYDPVHGVSLNGKTRIITIELSKLGEIVKKPIAEMSASERWAVFLGYLTDRNKRVKINEILEQEEGIAMASQVLMAISRDEAERWRVMSEEKYEMDRQSELIYAIETVARNALAEGASVEYVKKITGLSIERILSLK